MTDEQKIEQIAECLHSGWRDYWRGKGVVHGTERGPNTHPHMVDWDELDKESKDQDRFIASTLFRAWQQNSLPAEDIPAAIHNAWASWSRLQSGNHPHAEPYVRAHETDTGEHLIQAERVTRILESW